MLYAMPGCGRRRRRRILRGSRISRHRTQTNYRTFIDGWGAFRAAPALRPGGWDLQFGEVAVVELDEELHFNRYRAMTLSASWTARLPWTDHYLRYCREHEDDCLSAGRWGKRWTNPSSERMFGKPAPPGELPGAGAPRWKQRALYDAMKDLGPAAGLRVRLARVSVHDHVEEQRLWDVLEGNAAVPADAIREFVEGRIA